MITHCTSSTDLFVAAALSAAEGQPVSCGAGQWRCDIDLGGTRMGLIARRSQSWLLIEPVDGPAFAPRLPWWGTLTAAADLPGGMTDLRKEGVNGGKQ